MVVPVMVPYFNFIFENYHQRHLFIPRTDKKNIHVFENTNKSFFCIIRFFS